MTIPERETVRRRARRPISRSSSPQPMVGLINAVILAVGLTIILASRCDDSPTDPQGGWLDSLITPRDLQLPKSVTDRLQESSETSEQQERSDHLGQQESSLESPEEHQPD